jgi:hypothetical protein
MSARNFAIERISRRVPLLKRIPVVRLLLLAELAIVARRHIEQLTPRQRRRLLELVRKGRDLTPKQKEELRTLVHKLEPRAFAGSAVERLSPVPLPRRLTKAKY